MLSKRLWIILMSLIIAISQASTGLAKVTPEEAVRLGKDLTEIGAERAGNAEGTIPPYEGGLTYATTPDLPRIAPGDKRPNPFPDDKPLFTITAGTAEKYADKLSPGQLAFFKKYPDWRMNVYQSRRTAAIPEFFRKGTIANATTAVLSADSFYPENFTKGFPFPIPQNGTQAILNHNFNYYYDTTRSEVDGRVVLANGTLVDNGSMYYWGERPFNQKGNVKNDQLMNFLIEYKSPPRRKGELILSRTNMKNEDAVWSYIPGQRRVRRAPGISYDTPDPSTRNLGTYDDSYMFTGKIDRYDWKLKGKKEMYILYNNFEWDLAPTIKEILTPKYPNPDYLRWELHRVWVVEATLKEGKRHIYGKRVFYIDEDSWTVVATDKYTNRGDLWRMQLAVAIQTYDHDTAYAFSSHSWLYHDLTGDDYCVTELFNEAEEWPITSPDDIDSDMFTPEYLRKMGRR